MNVPLHAYKPQAFENYRCGTVFTFGDDKREFFTWKLGYIERCFFVKF